MLILEAEGRKDAGLTAADFKGATGGGGGA
jgi:hypothetical protein